MTSCTTSKHTTYRLGKNYKPENQSINAVPKDAVVKANDKTYIFIFEGAEIKQGNNVSLQAGSASKCATPLQQPQFCIILIKLLTFKKFKIKIPTVHSLLLNLTILI